MVFSAVVWNSLIVVFYWITFLSETSGQFDENFILQNVWGRLQPNMRSIIQCLSDDNHKKIKFSRLLDTGQGSKLPKSSQQFMQGNPVFARILFMPKEDQLNRFGAFQCKVVRNHVETKIIALKLPPANLAELDALSPYNVVNLRDSVQLEVNVTIKLNLTIKWRHNGVELPEWDDHLKIELNDVNVSDSGIYEAYYEGRRSLSLHALMRLIVRGCPAELYGVVCDKECPPCYNGGICHDRYGVCVCPSGFSGTNCEIACGGNHFGADCSKSCSPPQNTSNTDELCALHLFCKPDPYGCSCAPGFKGSKCMEHCEPGWYGADCKQPCHCAFGVSSCNRITGACDGGCARGWRGNSCQIEDPNANNTVETTTMIFCSPGTYGPSCEKECHCAGNEHCHIITGQCPYGCEDGWGGSSCGTCRENRFGENCEMTCHCEGGYRNCDKDGFCYSGCEAGWAGFTCQAECTPGRFGPNCASTCHCHENSTTPCDKVTGICEGDCEPGYMGSDCQTLCPPNTYGVNCVETCICSNGGHCNRVDGSCACDGRWRGLICNESEPQIIAASDEEVNIGQQVFISCTADAVPEPLMNISCSEFPGLNVNIRSLEQDQYQAVVKVKPQKAGTFDFLCTARNQHGFDMKKMIIVVIELTFSSSNEKLRMATVRATENPDPPVLTAKPVLVSKTNLSISIRWREWQYSKDIGGSPSDKIEYMAVYREVGATVWDKVDGWATDLSITIPDLVPYTLYEVAVKCRRLGKGGEGEAGPSLKIKTECGVSTADGIPQEFLPEKISESTVTLTWTQPTESFLRCPLTGYRLIYHPESAETVLGIRDIGRDKTSAELEDLSPNTVYVVHLHPITSIEMSKYFAELIFRTSETVPGPVSDLECQAVDGQPNLLLVSWEAPSEVNGAIKGYIISYTLMDRGQCGVSGDSDDSGMRQMQSDDTEVTLQNLYPYSTYNITVQARTSAGEGEGVSATATTSEAAPNEAPQNIRVISVTSSSLEFGWDPVPCESANGIVIHYEYMVVSGYDIYPTILQRVKRSSEETDSHLLIVEGHQVKIGNLKPHTFYGFMVRGVTAAGSGPLSDIIFHKTEESVSSQPLFLDIISVASEKLGVAWRQPESPNGEIIQYRAQVWDHELSHLTADVTFNVTEDENEEGKFSKVIENLKPASDYFIKIQAATRAGWGAFSDPIPGRTLDGVPGEPSEIDVLENGQRTINITWQPPILQNGVITGYKIIYRPLSTLDPVFNATPFVSLEKEVGGDVTDVSLQDLHPSTEYNITIQAKTSAGYGRPAEIKTWTVILGDHVSPSVRAVEVEATNDTIPILFSTTGSTSVYKYQVIVEDARNSEPIDEDLLSDFDTAVVKQKLPYYIAAELDPQNVSSTGEHSFVVGDRKVWGGYKNVHLNPGHEYKIRIRTLVVKDQELKSVLSEPKEETAASTFVQVLQHKKPKIFGMEPIVFILILIAVLVLITAITFLTILAIYSKRQRKKSTNSFSTRDSGLSGSMTWSVMYKVPDNEVIESPLVTSGFRTLPLIEKNASLKRSKSDSKIVRGMRIETLEEFLINVRGTNQLVEEFKRLVEGQTSPWTAARKNCNLKKNRYGNILPYDRSRVVLHTDSNKSDSDYINASYIDGYRRPREYIVTQGPLENTITDFWRMIWQENSPVIVMVTDLVENGKKKCAKYWPDDSIMCDDMQILVIHSEESTDFVIRTILMRKMDEIRTHRVMQYQFTGWPDRSVPTNTNYFIKFLKKVRDDHPVMGGPMVVMCSAGAGRSGTYVAIDALCQQAAEDKRVDVFRFVNNARHQRIHFVQTLEQYTFIYEALVEAIQYEDTSVPLEKIGMYLKELNHMSTLDQRALILKQYNKLNRGQKKVDANRCSVALSEVNIFKNRDPLTVPEDAARVKVYVDDRNEDHMGYINAVFVDGYRKKGAYIVTQMPMTHTTEDFWRMIYQYRSSFIVMLNGSDETDDLNVGIYWPELGGCNYGEFEVDVITYEEHEDFIIRIMKITNSLQINEDPHEVIQFQYKAWSSEMKPASMLKLLHNTDLWYHKSAGGPITVHCMDGATRSGLFIAACFIRDQINSEELLDTFQVVKSIRLNRPEFIPNSDQYRFLFEVAQELADPIIHRYEELNQPAKKLSFKI